METRKAVIENLIVGVWPQYWISETTEGNGPFKQTYIGRCNPSLMPLVLPQLRQQLAIMFPPDASIPQSRLTQADIDALRHAVPSLIYD